MALRYLWLILAGLSLGIVPAAETLTGKIGGVHDDEAWRYLTQCRLTRLEGDGTGCHARRCFNRNFRSRQPKSDQVWGLRLALMKK